MNEKERLNALEVALSNELREREFYLKNAERTRNPFGKAMFKQFGDEELEHFERLKDLHRKWEKQEKWAETVPLRDMRVHKTEETPRWGLLIFAQTMIIFRFNRFLSLSPY